jgi:hypothetical protein
MVEQFHIDPMPPKVSHYVAQTDTYSAIPASLQPPSPTTLESQ